MIRRVSRGYYHDDMYDMNFTSVRIRTQWLKINLYYKGFRIHQILLVCLENCVFINSKVSIITDIMIIHDHLYRTVS
jgi:hypothetical protein